MDRLLKNKREVFVVGHKNPDTDSICSAIAYAYLKNQTSKGDVYIPKRAGEVSSETAYVLERFGHKAPDYMENVRTQVQDVLLSEGERVRSNVSVKKAWEILRGKRLPTLSIVDENQNLQGLITIGDIAKSIMDVHGDSILSESQTPYSNIVETLEAEVLVGDITDQKATGKVIIATANPDVLEDCIEEGDMVILGDRYESMLCAIEMKAGCLIICINSQINPNIIRLAEERGIKVLRTHYDTFITARLLNQSIPIGYFMIKSNLIFFRLDNYIEDIRGIMAKVRHREFPVFDVNGHFVGMITRHSLLELQKKRVILVDHNESSQAIAGLDEAELEEIVDHHKLGYVETLRPVMFRNQPVGCTATIIYMMFQEQKVAIPADIAGLMCSAILSDTLLYRSPTCTPYDRMAAEALAAIAGISTQDHAKAMFTAASNLSGKTDKEIFNQDFKRFTTGNIAYGVGQITSMDGEELLGITDRMVAFMEANRIDMGLDMMFFMMTDILEESTWLICVGPDALQTITEFTGCETVGDHCVFMKGVVSRKKQLIPVIMQALS